MSEHGADSTPQLFVGAGGEILSGLLLDGSLEALDKLLEVFHFQFVVQFHAFGMFHLFYNGLEGSTSSLFTGFMPSTTSPYICTKRR